MPTVDRYPLAKSLFQDVSFIDGLLEQLDDMFVVEET